MTNWGDEGEDFHRRGYPGPNGTRPLRWDDPRPYGSGSYGSGSYGSGSYGSGSYGNGGSPAPRGAGHREERRLPRRMALAVFGAVLITGTVAAAADLYSADLDGGSPGGNTARPALPGRRTTAPTAVPSARSSRSPRLSRSSRSSRGRAVSSHDDHVEAPMYYIEDGPGTIALTIDDGPSPVYTPQILRLLAEHQVTATFSMVGTNVSYYPEIAREVADAGHLIVNHTWSHANVATLSAARMRDEIVRATDVIHDATGQRPGMFRAPYGSWSRPLLEYCAAQKLTPLDWSVDPRDWARPGVSAIVRNILRTTHTGSIILEHDGGGDRAQTVEALGIVLPRLLDEGFRFRQP